MELPSYHVPAWGNVLRATWERGWSFIKRAGTVILASTIILWFLQGFGFENGAFCMVEDQDNSILAIVASAISWIFIPQGFGDWRATVASISASTRSADTALFRRSARSSPATNTPASRRNTTSARRSRVWKNPAILYHAALSDNNNVR